MSSQKPKYEHGVCFIFSDSCSTSQEEVWEVAAQLIGLGLGILIIVCYFFQIYSLESPNWILVKILLVLCLSVCIL